MSTLENAAASIKREDLVTGIQSTVGQVPGVDSTVATVEGLTGSLKRDATSGASDTVGDALNAAGLAPVVAAVNDLTGGVSL